MNRILKTILRVFAWAIVGILLLITPWFIGPLYNDLVLDSFSKQLFSCPLPEKIVMVEEHKVCGKLNGCGDGMDFLACILIKSDKTTDELEKYFETLGFKGAKPSSKTAEVQVLPVTENKLNTEYIERDEFEILFNETIEFHKYKYYAVVIYDGGYWGLFDGRGA